MKFTFLIYSCVGLLWSTTTSSTEMNYGHFEGAVKVEWVRGSGDEKRMKLLDDVVYVDPQGKKWVAQKGYETDGASIPQVFWSIIGGSFDGQYREAAVIHDWYCFSKIEPWRDVHRIFYYANRAAGVSEIKSKILYMAVRVGGPKWGDNKSKCYNNCHVEINNYKLDNKGVLVNTPPVSEDEAKKISQWVSEKNPTLEEIEGYVNSNYPDSNFGH